jgi:hypothetical protein
MTHRIRQQANSYRFFVARFAFDLDLDLHTAAAQTPQNATWVQAERRRCGVGRAAWMPRERRQDMDVRSARAHGASPEGTTTKESPNQEPETLGYLGLSSNPPKAEQFGR